MKSIKSVLIHTNYFKIICCLLFFISLQTHSSTVKHLKGRAYLLSGTGNQPLAREQNLSKDSQIILDANSQIQIQWDDVSFIEVIGPARFQLKEDILILEFGRFLLMGQNRYPYKVRLFNEVFRPGVNSPFEIEIPLKRNQAQILVFEGALSLAGKTLSPNTLYLLESNRLQKGPPAQGFAQQRREDFSFSKSFILELEQKETHQSYRNQLIFSLQSHLLKIAPDSTLTSALQNTLGFSSSVEWNHKRYWDIAKHPTRIQYLKAPAWRIGLGTQYFLSKVQATSATQPYSQLYGAYLASGASWLGLSIEGLLSYSLGKSKSILLSNPIGYGFRTRFEWDLNEVTRSDIMLSLGYVYQIHKMKYSNSENPAPATQPFQVVRHGLDLSLHFNF